jgi:hypothetical protein
VVGLEYEGFLQPSGGTGEHSTEVVPPVDIGRRGHGKHQRDCLWRSAEATKDSMKAGRVEAPSHRIAPIKFILGQGSRANGR